MEEVQVNKDEEDEAAKEEEDVEYLCMSLIFLTPDSGEGQNQTKYDQNVGIQGGHNLLQRITEKISTLVTRCALTCNKNNKDIRLIRLKCVCKVLICSTH